MEGKVLIVSGGGHLLLGVATLNLLREIAESDEQIVWRGGVEQAQCKGRLEEFELRALKFEALDAGVRVPSKPLSRGEKHWRKRQRGW